MASPILIYPGGGILAPPLPSPPVTSQSGITPLVEGQSYIDVVFGTEQTDVDWIFAECTVVNTTDPTPLNIWPGIVTVKTTGGFRLQLNGLPDSSNYYLQWGITGVDLELAEATYYILSGPSSGEVGEDSAPFTVALPSLTTLETPVTVTPSDGGAGGTFTPASVELTPEAPLATFTYTPASYGTKTISVTNSGALTDPAPLTFTPLSGAYTLAGPSSGSVGVASTNFTVALPVGGAVSGTVTVTPYATGGGTFTPTSVELTTAAPSATFTYTPASAGAKTISVTNNGGLTDPADIVYTATAPFSPLDIAGCKLWLKADAEGLSDGASITTLHDSSGNGYDFSGGGVYKINIVNGKAVVRFAGVAGHNFQNITSPIIPAGSTAYTVFAVASPASTSAGSHAIFYAGTPGLAMTIRRDAGALNDYHWTGSGFANVADIVAIGVFNIVTADWDGTNIHLYKDGALKGTSGATLLGNAGNITSIAWDYIANTNFWDGDIAEVLVYNTALSSTDRHAVESYLGTKYGITVTPGLRDVLIERVKGEE